MKHTLRALAAMVAMVIGSVSMAGTVSVKSGSGAFEQAGGNTSSYSINSLPYNGVGASAGNSALSTGIYALSNSGFDFKLAQFLYATNASTRSGANINFQVAAATTYNLLGSFSSLGNVSFLAQITLNDISAAKSLYFGSTSGNSSSGGKSLASASGAVLLPGHTYQLQYSLLGAGLAACRSGLAFGSIHFGTGSPTVVPLPLSVVAAGVLLVVLVGYRRMHRIVA